MTDILRLNKSKIIIRKWWYSKVGNVLALNFRNGTNVYLASRSVVLINATHSLAEYCPPALRIYHGGMNFHSLHQFFLLFRYTSLIFSHTGIVFPESLELLPSIMDMKCRGWHTLFNLRSRIEAKHQKLYKKKKERKKNGKSVRFCLDLCCISSNGEGYMRFVSINSALSSCQSKLFFFYKMSRWCSGVSSWIKF